MLWPVERIQSKLKNINELKFLSAFMHNNKYSLQIALMKNEPLYSKNMKLKWKFVFLNRNKMGHIIMH